MKEKLFTIKIIEKGPVTEREFANGKMLYRGWIKTDHPALKDKFLNVPMWENKLPNYKVWQVGDEITVLVRRQDMLGKPVYDVMGLM